MLCVLLMGSLLFQKPIHASIASINSTRDLVFFFSSLTYHIPTKGKLVFYITHSLTTSDTKCLVFSFSPHQPIIWHQLCILCSVQLRSGPVYLEFASDATKLKAQSHKTAPTSEANCKPRPPVSDWPAIN